MYINNKTKNRIKKYNTKIEIQRGYTLNIDGKIHSSNSNLSLVLAWTVPSTENVVNYVVNWWFKSLPCVNVLQIVARGLLN